MNFVHFLLSFHFGSMHDKRTVNNRLEPTLDIFNEPYAVIIQ